MNVLRIFVTSPISPNEPVRWSLHDASGVCMSEGEATPDEWPAADRIEAVVAASQVRLTSVELPPLPPARIPSAAGFALEDRLASTGEAPMLAVSAQKSDGRVIVAIVSRTLLASLQSRAAGRARRIVKTVAEPELASPEPGWCWCAGRNEHEGDSFLRLADGSAFPVSAHPASGSLPPELMLALDNAERSGARPTQVRVDAEVSDQSLEQWYTDTGVSFVRGAQWRWNAASPAQFSAATNLLQGEFAAKPVASSADRTRAFRPAIVIAASALVLHVVATLGEWAWWRIDAWRATRAMQALAVAAGANASDANTFESARAALARRYAEARHSHRLAAPSDALPLLARAAPPLAAAPAGFIKSATYADGHWTIDLQRSDPNVVRDLDLRLKRAGAPATTVATASGARIRFGSE
jgi:hypothetical protein